LTGDLSLVPGIEARIESLSLSKMLSGSAFLNELGIVRRVVPHAALAGR